MTCALVANAPQFAVSVIFQAVRTQVCTIHVAQEWNRFSASRVTRPKRSIRDILPSWFKWLKARHTQSSNDSQSGTELAPMQDRATREGQGFANTASHAETPGHYLRVSWPEGQQETPYLLSMPFTYAACIMVSTITMHWVLSQAAFVSQIINFNANGTKNPQYYYTIIGYSGLAIAIAVTGMGSFVILYIAVGWRHLDSSTPTMPLAGVCSLAIAAACHPPSKLSKDHPEFWTGKMVWGVVEVPGEEVSSEEENERQVPGLRCCFSPAVAGLVRMPVEGEVYI